MNTILDIIEAVTEAIEMQDTEILSKCQDTLDTWVISEEEARILANLIEAAWQSID